MDKSACKRWFKSQRTMYGKVTHMKSGQGAPHFTDRQKWLKRNLGFSIPTSCAIIPQTVPSNQPAKPQFLRKPNTSPSAESDQLPGRVPGSVEKISVGSRSTLQLSGISPPLPKNPSSTQLSGNPTISKSEFQMEAQERRKKLEALEDKLEWMMHQKSHTAAYCELLYSELENLSKKSFKEFQVETVALIRPLK